MRKSKLVLNKTVYVGMTILENSKILMYHFFYNTLKKHYGPKCELLYSDPDSQPLEIETEDVYKDMEGPLVADLFNTSDYPKEHPLHSEKKKFWEKRKMNALERQSPNGSACGLKCMQSSWRTKKYEEGEGSEKERCQEADPARALQRNAIRQQTADTWNEHTP